MRKIEEILADYDIQIRESELMEPAVYDPLTNNIYIGKNSSGIELRNAILHEAGHGILHNQYKVLYHSTAVSHLKMESEANKFMVNYLVQEYLEAYGTDIPINIYDFMRNNRIESKNELLVKSAFLKAGFQHSRKVQRQVTN
ncbi:ImmA/IrrE family metallo-endopeptidase [Limosilactobacillus balticus]|uniref:ImmA/IrrE family metallo-endopeptidase n=1 Tax=Limosilactobacillus balticus TaxID=2759747 RepID=A0ABS8RE63_9LACO|nr:ImmA/IrrE family metallo-endopeptidase [Limosilactobacillus balticus]MCD7138904.1 ImmA/IrrE family metallo-endopeptidase [Limosilactobacillus balticus]